jgi:hypothetical protein
MYLEHVASSGCGYHSSVLAWQKQGPGRVHSPLTFLGALILEYRPAGKSNPQLKTAPGPLFLLAPGLPCESHQVLGQGLLSACPSLFSSVKWGDSC